MYDNESIEHPVVSLIIPVYNAEATLERCLDSVIAQSYPHLEIIVINDGSTDRTKAILDGYATQDNRIKVLHVQNGGVSKARNLGLQTVTGDFIQFLDSDDWLEQEATEMLVQSMTQGVELVIADYIRVTGTQPDCARRHQEKGRHFQK